eukprot:comp19542_c0_seq1/m.37235 comp19542_c0_seq1/g.37235  ORF comp19542_c0_seq1/g.37235 comp19542_c0_seq1/m.37235 type:complete len:560 (-) comp19542_c0_seq1:64-1743(-)
MELYDEDDYIPVPHHQLHIDELLETEDAPRGILPHDDDDDQIQNDDNEQLQFDNAQFADAKQVPPIVREFIIGLERSIRAQDVYEINNAVELIWSDLSEHFFSHSTWPHPSVVSQIVDDDSGVFTVLYSELYYRHIYTKLKPTLLQRIESWENYAEIFHYLLDGPRPLNLVLPIQWMWNIIDEFVYQFQSWTLLKAQIANRTEEEIRIYKENPKAWDKDKVQELLQKLVDKSCIVDILRSSRPAPDGAKPVPAPTSEYAQSQTYVAMGYYAIIGLARYHCLLSDYRRVLETLAYVDISKKNSAYSRITSCQVATFYYLGFAFMMLRRYTDTIKTLNNVLTVILRSKPYQGRSYQYDAIIKKSEQMYALLAICVSLCPYRVDEQIHAALREKLSEKLLRMHKGEEAAYEELFRYACPRFHRPTVGGELHIQMNGNPYQYQLKLFMEDVRQELAFPNIKSVLKLYTSISIQKLATFLNMAPEKLLNLLMALKYRSRQLQWTGQNTPPLEGRQVNTGDIEFYIENNVIHVLGKTNQPTYSDFFIRHINKLNEVSGDLKTNSA